MPTLTEDAFVSQFQPQVNHFDLNASFDFDYGGCLYEIFGCDIKAVRTADPAHVRTLLEADGVLFIASGYHFVNRLGYFLTVNPVPGGEDYTVELEPFE